MRGPSSLVTRERTDAGASVLVITNMWPDAEKPAYGVFTKRQVDSVRALGIKCDVLYVRGYRSSLAYAWAALLLLGRSIGGADYRLVHAHGGETGVSAAWYLRAPVVISYCGGDLLGTIEETGALTRGSRVRRRILRAQSRMFGATITKSSELERLLPRRVRLRNHVIPNGVDTALFAPLERDEARRRLGWPRDGRVALFAADPISGGSRTARRSGRSDKRYWLAEEACDRARAQLGDLRLHAAAGVAPEEMPLLMNAADCLLLTSPTEGSPNVVKEALMCNLPVVTTPVGDVRDVLAGVEPSFITDHSPESLAGALVRCLEHPCRSNGRERSGWLAQEVIAERLLRLYASLAPALPAARRGRSAGSRRDVAARSDGAQARRS